MSGSPYTPPLARDGDPDTSQAAADSVTADGTVETHERRILAVLRDIPRGGTATEIAAAVRSRWGIRREVDFCKHTVCRRFAGLLSLGLIHRRADYWATAKANARYARLAAQGRAPRRRPGVIYQKRGGETLHWFGRGDFPLCPGL